MTQVAQLPERIARLVEGKPYQTDGVGLSGSQIRIYDGCVLKIAAERHVGDVRCCMEACERIKAME